MAVSTDRRNGIVVDIILLTKSNERFADEFCRYGFFLFLPYLVCYVFIAYFLNGITGDEPA